MIPDKAHTLAEFFMTAQEEAPDTSVRLHTFLCSDYSMLFDMILRGTEKTKRFATLIIKTLPRLDQFFVQATLSAVHVLISAEAGYGPAPQCALCHKNMRCLDMAGGALLSITPGETFDEKKLTPENTRTLLACFDCADQANSLSSLTERFRQAMETLTDTKVFYELEAETPTMGQG